MTALLSPGTTPPLDIGTARRSGSARGERRDGGAGWRQGWTAYLVTAVSRGVLAGLALALAWCLLPALFGWQSAVVMSGSMSPHLQVGDVAVVRAADQADLRLQQVLLVDDPDHPGGLRLHRLVGMQGSTLTLRGDANGQDDSSSVDVSAVHGVGTLLVPHLGAPLVWWSHGDVLPVLGCLVGLLGLVTGACLAVRPEDEPSAHASSNDQRSGDGPATLADPVRRRGLPLRVAVVLGTSSVLVLIAVVPAAARFTAATRGDILLGTNRWYTCAAAEAATGATRYYALQDTAGPTATNSGTEGASSDGTFIGSPTFGQPGPNGKDGRYAVGLNGADQYLTTPSTTVPDGVTVSFWFRTNTQQGGMLLSFGDAATGPSVFSDREIYLTDAGELIIFAADSGGSGNGQYLGSDLNDGKWHYVAATFSSAGSALYVDTSTTSLMSTVPSRAGIQGYWRFGYEDLSAWSGLPRPSSWFFEGSVAHVSIHHSVLDDDAVFAEYHAGRANLD